MKVLLTLIFVFSSAQALAKLPKPDWEISSGTLTYHVSYPLKNVDGVSKSAKGKGRCESGSCQFLIAVPVKSFDSGDGNRDNHMLETTKAALNPMVIIKSKFNDDIQNDLLEMNLEVTFAGKTHTYEHVKVKTQIREKEAKTSGTIPLVLSDFDIERPSLLTVKIADSAPVDFDLTWH